MVQIEFNCIKTKNNGSSIILQITMLMEITL